MLKLLFLTHRYLGIGLGIVMVLWCLSGFVMMYKPYPELSEIEQLELLPPLQLENCCSVPSATSLGEWQYESFHIQMLGIFPTLHLNTTDNRLITIDLEHDRVFHTIPDQFATHLSENFANSQAYPDSQLLDVIKNDQWTVYGAYNVHRPLYQFSANDQSGTQWYLSSRTGEVIQLTTRSERVWGYLGAVIHWLYPTLLREKVALWSQVVIWLTIIGLFLTITGIYFGLRQYKSRKNGRKSPYRGLSFWHHYAGLFFGVLTFSWVFSGLFSMNPWGILEGESMRPEQQALQGGEISWQEITDILPRLNDIKLSDNAVRIEGKKLLGDLSLFVIDATAGSKERIEPRNMKTQPIENDQLQQLTRILSPENPPEYSGMLNEEDMFHYHHHAAVQLPVYKIIAGDSQNTHYYLDPDSGELLRKVDGERKVLRWLYYGLHRGDFNGFLRSRPVWDIFMWTLLLGVTAVCITGFFMGMRRLGKSI